MIMRVALIAIVVSIAAADSGQCNASEASGGVCEDVNTSLLANNSTEDGNASLANSTEHRKEIVLSGSRLALVLAMFGAVVVWIGAVIKFAIDGSLPARLALWGLVPEVCAAVSVRSIVALLRLKTEPTPAIVLRQCVDDVGAKRLADAMVEYGKVAELQVVELPYNPKMGEEGLRSIVAAGLAKDSQLAELDISYNPQIGDKAVDELRPLLMARTCKLEVLRLAGCGFSPKGLGNLANIASRMKIKTLDLGRTDLAGQGETVASICDAPMLEGLTLTCCNLKLEDVRQIAEQLPFTSIRTLQLGGNGFGSDGLLALSEHLPTCMVDELGLEYNEIEFEALSHLGSAWAKRPFARVNLKGNRVDPEQLANFIKTLKTMCA